MPPTRRHQRLSPRVVASVGRSTLAAASVRRMGKACTVLLVSGSVREGSTNGAVIRTAAAVAPEEVNAIIYGGLATLPHFNPELDRDPLPVPVARLRSAIDEADAVLFCTPEYAGTLPGSFKNLLDWTVGGTVMSGKPVGWINASATTGAPGAHATLQTVLGYVDADRVEAACVHVPVPSGSAGDDGTIGDAAARAQIAAAIKAMSDHITAIS